MFCHACLIWLPLSLFLSFLYKCFCHAGSVLTGVSSSGLVFYSGSVMHCAPVNNGGAMAPVYREAWWQQLDSWLLLVVTAGCR